jgi:hypothetical protein
MTGKELIDQVCLLGARTTDEFEHDFESEHIYSSINRAISEVNRLFPVEKTVQLLHYPIRPAVYIKGITVHKGGEDTVFDASDIKSLAFAVSGTGSATLETEGAQRYHTFTWEDATQLTVQRAIIDEVLEGYNGGRVTLTFKGEYSYMISDVSFYSEIDGPVKDDVDVYSSWMGYDIALPKYAGGNFLGFSSLPVRFRDIDLNAPTDYYIEDSKIFLRRSQPGIYEVRYYKATDKINGENIGGKIDVDFRLHDLIALRAAYYIYAVLDPEAAKVCDTEYQKLLGLVMTTMPKVRTPKKFRNVTGW